MISAALGTILLSSTVGEEGTTSCAPKKEENKCIASFGQNASDHCAASVAKCIDEILIPVSEEEETIHLEEKLICDTVITCEAKSGCDVCKDHDRYAEKLVWRSKFNVSKCSDSSDDPCTSSPEILDTCIDGVGSCMESYFKKKPECNTGETVTPATCDELCSELQKCERGIKMLTGADCYACRFNPTYEEFFSYKNKETYKDGCF